MKLKELEDIAYQIATSNFTTKEMNLEEWNNCKTEDVIWEPFENHESSFTENNVCNLADDIIYSFKHLCSDYNE